MNAGTRRSAAQQIAQIVSRLIPSGSPGNGRLAGIGVLILVVVIGLFAAWHRWGGGVVRGPQFQLTIEKLEVNEQPPWIDSKTDIRAEVFRDSSLSNINLLDEQSAVQIARAFELHTWVNRVVRVQKQAPGRVSVELEYRRPVALVEVLFNNVLSYEPVDAHGVVLPEDLFHHDQKNLDNYLRITADYSMPPGPLGTPWGDDRIIGGAHIAAIVEKAWQKWNLYRIVANPPSSATAKCTFEILSHGSSRILWGHGPGQESSDEPGAIQKLTWLAEFLTQHGPLDAKGAEAVDIDLRHLKGLLASPREAHQP